MRCIACNVILTPQESCTKFKSGTPTEMCSPCLSTIDIPVQIPQRFLQKQLEDDEFDPPWEEDDEQAMMEYEDKDDEWLDS